MSQVNVTQVVAEVMVPFTEGNDETPGTQTVRVGTGNGNAYYAVWPIIDSGDELRTKVIKSPRVTSKRTNQFIKLYTWDVNDEINADDLEDGTNSATGAMALSDTSHVAQSELLSANCTNASLSTIRVEGQDTGESVRDQIHEAVYQQAIQGVRR